VLEGGDRTVGAWAGGLEMGEDLRRRVVRRYGRQRGRHLAGQAERGQCRADLALTLAEAFPDALQGAVAEMAADGAAGGEHGAGKGAGEEPPQAAGRQAEPSDFVSAPDAKGPPATGACIAVAAKDPPGAHGFLLAVVFVIAVPTAVAIQRADDFAMRTRCQLEPLGHGVPFLGVAAKPLHFAHSDRASPKIVILAEWGEEAGY
jgi:hypothetical protein